MKIKSLYEITADSILRSSYEDGDILRSMDRYFQEKILEKKRSLAFQREGLVYPGEESIQLHLMIEKEEAFDYTYVFTVSMMFYAIILYSSTMADDLQSMQKTGVLERSVASPHNFIKLNLSYALANLFLLMISYTLIFIAAQKLMDLKIQNLSVLLFATILASFYSITLAQTAVRFLKHQAAVSTLTVVLGILGFVGGTFSYVEIIKIPAFLRIIGRVLPNYYLLDMIFTGRTLSNGLIVGLMILVILTAGSYKLDNYAKR